VQETRRLASEITSRGATLFELLGSEVDLRVRVCAHFASHFPLSFFLTHHTQEERTLSLSRGLEIDKVESAVRQSISAINEQIKNTLQ
jgi:hypothetical protein